MLKINSIGFKWIHEESSFSINRPPGTKDYLFLLFHSKVNVFFETETLHITSPAVFIYRKGTAQRYGYAGEPFINDWVHFDSDETKSGEVEILLKTLDIPVQTPIYINDTQTISNLISDLEYEYRQPNNLFQKNLIDAKVKTLLCKVACICHQEKNIPKAMNKYRSEFTNIRNSIYNIHGAYNIADFAEQVNMSVSYFQHVYKILFNSSPGQDIIKSRIFYACVLLRSENISIANISEKCRYSNVEHFIRQFKQHMKCTPGEYRNLHSVL